MVADEYSTGGGGKLKLKGSKVSDGRVDKKKKSKKGKKKDAESEAVPGEKGPAESEARGQEQDQEVSRDDEEAGTPEGQGSGKTETERKYEEIRRKRLHERLQRDGIKSHKERVEELNTYLSRLSEHHDMPKIGPG